MSEKRVTGTTAEVAVLPNCDVCKGNGDDSVPAEYDAKMKEGPWANMCVTHFNLYGIGLGIGKGQKLVLSSQTYAEMTEQPLLECALHNGRHPLKASWPCFDDLIAQAIANA